MQTSRKRNNHLNKFLGAILGICLLSGCSGSAATPSSTVVPVTPSPITDSVFDASVYIDVKVQTTADATLYAVDEKGAYQAIGQAHPNGIFDIDASNGNYAHIADSNFYLDGETLQAANRWYVNRNHLVWDGEQIVTDDHYEIQNLKGEVILTVDQSDVFDVYVKPIETDDRYGVQLQNEIVYISSSDVKENRISSLAYEVKTANRIPVLMYHFFYDETVGSAKDGNDVSTAELQEQLDWLQSENYTTLTMREVLYFMQGRSYVPEKSIAITIDDNDPSVHEYAYSIIKAHDMNATIFLITGWEDPTLSWDNWEMREDGLELQSHGFLMHQGGCSGMGHGGRLLCVDYEEGVQDTIRSFDYVDGGFVYCYPFGGVSERAKSIIADAGGLLAFTTVNGWIHPGMDLLELPRVRVTGGAGLARYKASIEKE